MERNIIIENICTACRCGERRAEEYLAVELRNLRELRDAGALCYGDLETACSGLGLDFDYTDYFCRDLVTELIPISDEQSLFQPFHTADGRCENPPQNPSLAGAQLPLVRIPPSDAEVRGRFISRKPFPAEAFRRQIGKLRNDRTLFLRIVSADLYTLYVEGNVYLRGAWHRIFL
ncbi:MAG: hypothetical protein ACLSH3_14655 [Alistipes finegoldii]